MANIAKSVKLGVFTLAIMNVTAVVSLRGLPAEAEYGVSSAFYYLFAALVFLIPTALVAAELAAMFQDKQGGVFRWVGEAFGKKAGFLAIWLQWIESTIWYPTVLTFGAVAIAFIGMDHTGDMLLASNRFYTLAVVLFIYWLATFISLKGLDWVGKVAKVGGLVGTIIPAGLLVVLAIVYLAMGGKSQMDFSGSFLPDFSNFDNLVLAASIFLFYAGMEMGGIHVKDINNPSKNYPKAVFIGSAITVLIFVLGTFALGIIIPQKDINLTQSLLVGFDNYFNFIRASWLSPVIAIALAFGVLAGVLTWVAGPSKGIFAVGRAGYLPPFFQKTNKIGVQKNILYPFRIGGKGNGMMWFIGGLGFLGSLLAFVLSFIPPSQISVGSNAVWFSVLIIGTLVVVIAPFIIYASRKPSWTNKDSQFEPFHWEEGATASAAPTATTTPAGNPATHTTAPKATASADNTTTTTQSSSSKPTPGNQPGTSAGAQGKETTHNLQ